MKRVVAGLFAFFVLSSTMTSVAAAEPPTQPALNPTSSQAKIDRLYQAVFDRPSDPAGLAYWTELHEGGRALDEIARAFTESTEFRATYGALDDPDFVRLVYRNVLDREADGEGLDHWVTSLETGTVSRATMMIGFSESEENRWRLRGRYDDSVERLFRAFFERAPDEAGNDYWTRRYLADGDLEAIAEAFSASDEFVATYGALGDDAYVQLVYENVLGRTADEAGLAHWTDQLRSGLTRGAMMIGFSESDEFRATLAASGPAPADCSIFDRVAAIPTEASWLDQPVLEIVFLNSCGDHHHMHSGYTARVVVDDRVVLERDGTTVAFEDYPTRLGVGIDGDGPWRVEIDVDFDAPDDGRSYRFDEVIDPLPIADIELLTPNDRTRGTRTQAGYAISFRDPSTAGQWDGSIGVHGDCSLPDGPRFHPQEVEDDTIGWFDLDLDDAATPSSCSITMFPGSNHALVGLTELTVETLPVLPTAADAPSDLVIESSGCFRGATPCELTVSVVNNFAGGELSFGGIGTEVITTYGTTSFFTAPVENAAVGQRVTMPTVTQLLAGVDFCIRATVRTDIDWHPGASSFVCADWNGNGWTGRPATEAEASRWG